MQAETILEIIESRIGPVQAIYLFGSAARGESRPDSDVDIAVLTTQTLTDLDHWTIAEELALTLGRDVDLVDLRAASTVLRSQVLTMAHPLYRRPGDTSVTAFEDFVYADYARLNEERAGILADIAATGTVHG